MSQRASMRSFLLLIRAEYSALLVGIGSGYSRIKLQSGERALKDGFAIYLGFYIIRE